VNHEQREAITANGFGLVDLWETSPVRFGDNQSHAEEIIDTIFPAIRCCAQGQATATSLRGPAKNGAENYLRCNSLFQIR